MDIITLIEPTEAYAEDIWAFRQEASEKTILVNGGIFEKMIDVDGSQMKRYWIEIM